ncbi:MAG: hypothetical protein V8Q73_06795 [Blautia sp.]
MSELNRNLEKRSGFAGSIDEELQMKGSVFTAEQSLRLKELDANISTAEKWIKRYTKLNEVLLSNIQSIKETLDSANLGLSQPTGGSAAEMSELLKRLNNLNGSMQKQMAEGRYRKTGTGKRDAGHG